MSIRFIRENEPPEGYMGCYSGGKDSDITKHITDKAGVKVKWYYSLMPDPPELIQHIKSRNFPITILKPEYSFWHGIIKNFPPHMKARWCCRIIKELPSTKIPLTHRLLGIRAEESRNRAKQGWINQRTKKRINYHPIFNWTEWEIWDYIEENNLEYCSLYDEGFSRLGCIVCPMRSKREQEFYFKRYPQYKKLFEKVVGKWWDKKGFARQRLRGYAYFLDEFLDNWYKGK